MTYTKDSIEFATHPTTWNFLDRTNTTINNLDILGYAGKSATKEPKTQWFVKCHCGNIFVAIGSNLGNGDTRSCGCFTKERIGNLNRSHQMSHTSEYGIWNQIKTRCYNPNNPNYRRYGARGIKMCDRWFHSFENFFADMGKRPFSNASIERRNNNGNYEPSNCYWADRIIQNNNTRTNVFIEYQGKTQTATQWARELGFKPSILLARIRCGWDVERAFTVPPIKRTNSLP